ncbi:type II secretion system F family protein [Cellvibrio mixtus]|uniref:type II secretion system F family protein n=1 Tax=Cellvibrio mixtus TaxID=39650 RepID=UPI000586A3F8|nr:type II secretion system F family protein [Cellvibrio mixtus]
MTQHFKYQAIDQQGKTIHGEMSAHSQREVVAQLLQQQLTVTDIELAQPVQDEDQRSRQRLTTESIITALYELAAMLNSGVSAVEAVGAQATSSAHPKLRYAFKLAAKTLRHGGSFEQAMDASQLPLPNYVNYLIRAGEMTGQLGQALSDACVQMQYELTIKNETRNALIYPGILVISGISAVLLMFVYVVPSFTNLLEQSDRLPFLAWAVLSSGKWANENFLLLILLLLVPPAVLFFCWSQPGIKVQLLEKIESLPVVGEWISQADVAAWSKVLSSLVRNRVELITALELAAESVRMPSRKHNMIKVKNAVRGGESLSVALEANQCLTATGYNLIRVGERAGKLEEMLNALSNLYTIQGQQRMKKALILIEPIAILTIGVVIGTIIVGIMLAITSANDIPL